MHACHSILSLFFFLTFYFFFLCFVTLLFHAFLSSSYSCVIVVIVVVVMLWISCYDCCCDDNPTVHGRGSLYTACCDWFFTILPLNHFFLGVGFLPDHPLVCQLPSHHHLPVLAMPHLITRQRNLFCLLVHHGIPIRNKVGTLSYYPSWHAPNDSNSSFSLLGGMSF